jgi:pyruvate/2-oxoglutarate dehydrogenase complex dihydrolipoamide dehydrogenase (E3) component
VSQLGMLPGTMVYVYAGTQLGQFRLSPGLFVAFTLIGLLPLAARRLLDALKARRVYARWPRPRRFDYNMVVIGAGSAGLVAAYIAAATKAKVALVERDRMGGDCLNTGCVPSKALLRAAKLTAQLRKAAAFGIEDATARVDFAAVMERVAGAVRSIAPHDSVERYRALGVDCIAGDAKIVTPWSVEVRTPHGARTLTTRSIVIAAGARPLVPPIPGLERAGYLTSHTVWNLRALPPRLVVLGGGPIGCELAQAFARLGSRVTLVEMAARLLTREDPDVSVLVARRLREDGIDVRVDHRALRVDGDGAAKRVVCAHAGAEVTVEGDAILVAVGRVANTAGYGLEELGVALTAQGTIETNEALQTIYPNIVACGDVVGPYHFTHTAAHQAWYAAVNALFGTFRTFKADYRVIPWATFTDPEVARVGLNATEATARGIAHTETVYRIDDLDRAIVDGVADGFVKVLTAPGTDRILGATIVGEHAADLIAEFVLAMKHGIGLEKVLGTIHIYPTLAEANKYAAGAWKRSTVTRGQWTALEAVQAWRRGSGSLGAVLRALLAMRRDRRPAYAEAPASAPTSPGS